MMELVSFRLHSVDMSDTPALKQLSMPAPQFNAETEAFWSAARDGRFIIRTCRSCAARTGIRVRSARSAGASTQWRPASGFGTIYSFSPMRQAPQPYIVAYVTLDEGPTMLTNIVNCEPENVSIGRRVLARSHPTEDDGPPVPVFAPA
jgi:uncharacterized OB-fold protein